jgi:hypothetical protein
MDTIEFIIRPHRGDAQGALEFIPVLNCVELVELVTRFARDHGMEPAGGYGGF